MIDIIELQKKRMGVYGENIRDNLENTIYDSFEENPAYKEAEHNNVNIGVHFIKSKFKDGLKEATVIPKNKNIFKRGSYLKLLEDNSIWLCNGVEDVVVDRCLFKKCNYNLKFIDKHDNLITKPCVVSAKTLYTTGIKDEKIIEIPNGMVGIQLPYDDETMHLDRQQCFVFNKTKYRITFYNEVEQRGLITLICSEARPDISKDDMANEIADRWTERNGIKVDRLPWLDSQDPPVENPNPEIPSQDIIYELKAQMAFPNNPDNEIWYGDKATYTVYKSMDGIELSGIFNFAISDTSVASVIEQTDKSVTIQASDILDNKLITLMVTDTETNKVVITKEITIVGRFG